MFNIKKQNRIYLDNAAATLIDPRVAKVISKSLIQDVGNPSAITREGVSARQKIELARKSIAKDIDAHPDEVIFTGSGTESNNIAILGVISSARSDLAEKGGQLHIVTTTIEHPSVLETCKFLENTGVSVTYVPVGENGIVDPREIKKAITPDTVLVSVMYANNEVGTIQSIREIAKEIRHFRSLGSLTTKYPIFHSDMVQAVNYLPLRMDALGVDFATFNGAKISGPRGIGALYIRRDTPITPILFGGDQENSLRPGTESTAQILGFAEAFKITRELSEKEMMRLTKIRDAFIQELKKLLRQGLKSFEVVINGDEADRLPNIVNATFPGYDHEALALYLDAKGISVSTKSACKSRDEGASHVLLAIGNQNGGIRVSFGRDTQKGDIGKVIRALKAVIPLIPKV